MIAGRIIFYYRVCTPKNWSHPDPDTVINRVYWLDGCGIIRRAIWSPADMRMMEFPVDTLLTIHSGDGPEIPWWIQRYIVIQQIQSLSAILRHKMLFHQLDQPILEMRRLLCCMPYKRTCLIQYPYISHHRSNPTYYKAAMIPNNFQMR